MDDQLLNDLYGINPQDHADDSMIKAAQAELVEAVADEAGVDLAEMDDVELDKFASYVLSDASDDVYTDPSLAEADQMGRVMAHAYADEQMKIAHQLEEQYLTQGDNTMYDDLGYALEKQAHAWDLVKEAKEKTNFGGYGANQEFKDLSYADRRRIAGRRFGKDTEGKRKSLADMDVRKRDYLRSLVGRGTGFYDIQSARNMGKQLRDARSTLKGDDLKAFDKLYSKGDSKAYKALSKAEQREMMQLVTDKAGMGVGTLRGAELEAFKRAKRGLMMRGAGKAGLIAAGLGGAGYAMSKKSSYDPVVEMVEDLEGWEFAKEAELRAAEILLENGIDPETFEHTYPESVKLASFPEPGDAYTHEGDYELAEYNEMLDDAAYDILEDLGF
jgi:hypothetical protein